MSWKKPLSLVVLACLVSFAVPADAGAQHRGRGPSRGPSHGAVRGPATGQAVRAPVRGPVRGPVYGPSRGVRAGGGVGLRYGYGYGYGPLFYYPWFGYAYGFYPYGYGGYGHGGYGYGGYGYGGYGYGAYQWGGYPWGRYFGGGYFAGADIRIQVQPKTAEVYVDGHLAGMVDDFDGLFQRLSVTPGGHEIVIYQEGYRGITERLYLTVGKRYSVKRVMERLAPGEAQEPRPQPVAEAEAPPDPNQRDPRSRPDPYRRDPGPPPERYPPEPGQLPLAPEPASAESGFGQGAIRSQPADAEVLIDGERWEGSQEENRLVVNLAAGSHRIEIRKAGFATFVKTVQVKPGETAVVNVSLTPQR